MVDQHPAAREPGGPSSDSRFVFVAACIVFAAVVVALCVGLYLARDVCIILLLALLFAVFLTKSASIVAGKSGWPYKRSLAACSLGLVVLSCGLLWLLGSRIQAEIADASEHVDEAKTQLREKLQGAPALRGLLNQTPLIRDWLDSALAPQETEASESASPTEANNSDTESTVAGPDGDESTPDAAQDGTRASRAENENQRSPAKNASGLPSSEAGSLVQSVADEFLAVLTQAVQTTFGLVLNSLIIIFVGLFLAVAPRRAMDGVVSLAPERNRPEFSLVMQVLGDALWRWLLGRLASMVVTGTGVGISLFLLGVPLAATLGVVTGLLTFIPNIGAAIALALAVFMAIPNGLVTMGWVTLIYLAFQLLESYIITPLIQQYQVSVPPALLISAQAVLGVLLGFLGAMIASPIVVIGLVLKTEVYERHWLQTNSS